MGLIYTKCKLLQLLIVNLTANANASQVLLNVILIVMTIVVTSSNGTQREFNRSCSTQKSEECDNGSVSSETYTDLPQDTPQVTETPQETKDKKHGAFRQLLLFAFTFYVCFLIYTVLGKASTDEAALEMVREEISSVLLKLDQARSGK